MEHYSTGAATGSPEAVAVEFDPALEPAAEMIRTAVALQSDTSVHSLDALARSIASRFGSTSAEIMLRYHGYIVTVHGYGTAELAPCRTR
jgi:hypothetical protein